MRTLQYLSPESRERTARETLEVYAPLAHRFGLARVRWQLEDQSLKFLEPEMYQELRESVAMTRKEREDYIEKFTEPIERRLRDDGIKVEFMSRAKNFYSIYNKMKERGKPFDEIYDLLAVRIITSTREECYRVLYHVHDIYEWLFGRFKDYISNPKTNRYQSIHTSVIDPEGRYVEVQIRTADMHKEAEIGIAAHSSYKSNDLDQHMDWMRQVTDWQQEASDPVEVAENMKTGLASQIFVFTPEGDRYQLPKGATPIDFAFAIHTDIGLHCAMAKVNGKVVPLSAALSSGETVEIVTTPQQSPKRAWEAQVKTPRARQKIRRWLREDQFDHNVSLGKKVLDRGLETYRTARPPDLDAVAKDLDLSDAEELYAALGNGDLLIGEVFGRFTVQLCTRSQDRIGLLADIARAIGDAGSNICESTTPRPNHGIVEQNFWIDVADDEQLRQAIDQIKQIEGVLEVLRVDEPASS